MMLPARWTVDEKEKEKVKRTPVLFAKLHVTIPFRKLA